MRLLLLSAFILCPVGAVAEDMSPTTIANWTVETIFDTCAAYNRPNSELQEAPIHVLGFSRTKDGGTTLLAAFWPGALSPDENALQITLSDVVVKIGAKPLLNDVDSLRSDELPDELMKALTETIAAGSLITLRAEPSLAEVSFEAGELPAVMAALEDCAATLD